MTQASCWQQTSQQWKVAVAAKRETWVGGKKDTENLWSDRNEGESNTTSYQQN